MTTLTEPAASTSPRRRSRTGWATVAFLAFVFTVLALSPYAMNSLDALAQDTPSIASSYVDAPAVVRLALYLHIVAGGIALLLGPLQFWKGLRDRFRRAHRIIGRVYLLSVLVGSAAALVIAPFNSAGAIGVAGFGLLAVLWFITGLRAYRSARARRIDEHQAWMIRNYALTFAAVMLRMWLPTLIGTQMAINPSASIEEAFTTAYAIVPFLCWVPNLLVAEWLVRRRGLPTLITGRARA